MKVLYKYSPINRNHIADSDNYVVYKATYIAVRVEE